MTMALLLTCIVLEESILFLSNQLAAWAFKDRNKFCTCRRKSVSRNFSKYLQKWSVAAVSTDDLCVVIDANQIGMRFKWPEKVAVTARVLATHRIDVIVAADGPSHLQTKWASVKRAADSECARIESIFAKRELALLLQNNSPDEVRKKS